MYSALGEPSELDIGLLRRNRFCMGVKRGKKYVCGGEADENAVNKAIELLSEAINRIQRWCVWDSWWVEEWMNEWLITRDRLEMQLRGKYSDKITTSLLGMIDRFIGYSEEFMNYWHVVGYEVRELINALARGRTVVVIRGENVSGVSVYGRHTTLEVSKASGDSITVKLVLKGLGGIVIMVPDVFKEIMDKKKYRRFIKKVLRALRRGLEETDGDVQKGLSAMGTTQIWQVLAWSLLYPGRVHTYVSSININEGDVTITWFMRSNHKSIRGRIHNDIGKLSKEEVLAFTFTAILGDGSAFIRKDRGYDVTVLEITMLDEKFKAWGSSLLAKLREMGFRSGKPITRGNKVEVRFYGSNAINLARAMIDVSPSILKDILDALGFEKWERIKRIAEMEVRWRKGEMQVSVLGYRCTVDVQKGTVRLALKAKDEDEAKRIIEMLRAVYDDVHARINRSHGKCVVRLPMKFIEEHIEVRIQVVKVLCQKYRKVKDEVKRKIIAMHLLKLATPTKGAAAAEPLHYQGPREGICTADAGY